ncbi:hypothetical protein AB0N20_22570 [Streptomyces griseoincarnatus]
MELYAPDGAAPGRRVGATRPSRSAEDGPAGPGVQEPPVRRPAGSAGGMAMGQAQALMAQMAAEDARFTGRR